MKKRIILLSGFLLISLFTVSLVAQDKPKEVNKAKTEVTKKEIPAKCAGCPSAAKCDPKTEANMEMKEDNVTAKEATPVVTNEKKKAKQK